MNNISQQLRERSSLLAEGVINSLAKQCYINSRNHGFHDKPVDDGTRLMLMVTELAECLEYIRHGNPMDDHIPEFTGEEAELADTMIIIFDYAGMKNLRLGEAILAKMKYNESRPYMHGKKL